MPRLRRRSQPRTLAYQTEDRAGRPRVITAAAQILAGPRIQRTGPRKAGQSTSQPWQADAWTLYDEVGELRFGNEWQSSAVSRLRLVAAKVSDSGQDPEPADEGLAAELVAAFAGGPAAQAQFMHRCASHLALTGDSYIVGRTVTGDDPEGDDLDDDTGDAGPVSEEEPHEEWQAYSTEETSYSQAGGWSINDGSGKVKIGPNDLIIRCWRPHPRLFTEATSAVRSNLPVIRELRGLTMHVAAQVDSRLAGAGLLLLPQSVTFASTQAQSGDANDGADPFVAELIEAMLTPIRDRDSAAAVVPVIAKVPDEAIGKAQYLSFASELDAKAKELRDEAIRRLALGLDMPPEVLLGMGDVNHWSAWQIDEASIRLHIAPLAATICFALTIGWLRPALAAAGESPDQWMVWFDTSPLALRPDRSGDVKDLYDRFLVGPKTVLRETGFGDDDAPTRDDLTRMVLLKLIDRVPDVQALVEALGLRVDLGQPEQLPPAGDDDTGGGGDSGGEDRSLPQRPTSPPDESAPSDIPASAAPAAACPPCEPCSEVLYAAHTACLRALEVAGKRLLTRDRRSRYQHVDPWLLHTEIPVADHDLDRLLDGAWSVLAEALPDRRDVLDAVDAYVRDLLRSGQPHERRWLEGALDRAGIAQTVAGV